MARAGVHPPIDLLDESGKLVWGVEWKTADTPDGLVIDLCNYLNTPLTFTLSRGGRRRNALDVLTGLPASGPITLQPLEVRLFAVKAAKVRN